MYDVIIIGAGAAGLMCAIQAGKRGRKVLLLDHSAAVAEKIRISGGGRCNFTNLHTSPACFISNNPKFCVSALKRFTQNDFIEMVEKHQISYHEKTLGQLFCDKSSRQIINMLLAECQEANVIIQLNTNVTNINKNEHFFSIVANGKIVQSTSLVIATGGLSIPKIGATGLGYQIAKEFGINIIHQRPALVPLTLTDNLLQKIKGLAGISLNVLVSCNKQTFKEAMLFTHRGLSGPAILQISSYWNSGDIVTINLCPEYDILLLLKEKKQTAAKQTLQTTLSQILPKRLAQWLVEEIAVDCKIGDLSSKQMHFISETINSWQIIPAGTEGYRTAEVTAGGVDTDELSSQSLEARKVKGLYFIGEVVDVTGHLGGYNFQWAWSSGFAAGQYV